MQNNIKNKKKKAPNQVNKGWIPDQDLAVHHITTKNSTG